ncbi:DNA-binding HxlR family transcriptional regulator [Myroides gitamensis]|uniref:HTH-type transcriptional activator hxlR n=1 Tax=Myroides odoratus TaxID=256 RepID=A0A378U6P3_MYROD|nr:helix-turn-helix domain-containing protein [Myroides odoratus]MCS4239556.1 DNA-binding HxlR family transcriptional regulator [Myroides odoratus]MDH6601406.1 DNA-binding HxlR family transcriptional regulator [Myroides gitamensis]QQU02641.1 helix-turn-helix transcriptional regulator [Myroides odoratus]STZ70140.1 HTH-type transcriptional activator hxlR [Myroides odoratus]
MKNNTNSDNEYTTVEKKLTDFENTCVAQQALKTITGKWKISIIKIVAAQCPKRFGILKRDLDHIAQGTLTTVLRELEQDGILAREAFAEIPPRVEYKLTAKGIKLLPILVELEQWYQSE